jgi:conjugative transposon TraM protein
VKVTKTESEYFNTVSQNVPGTSLITAIIDENVKAMEGSRVRLRLLDDVEIGGLFVPKGTYLYATMSGFGKQRVKGKIESVFVGDQIKTISLSIYDTDGLEGLYVPSSSFRETTKDIGSSAVQQSMSLDGSSSKNSVSQWAGQAIQQAYQRTSQAISKAIRKNKVKLKYGTRVYLINGKQLKSDKK